MNLKYHYQAGYYANFDPRQNALPKVDRKRIEDNTNTGELKSANNRLEHFPPLYDDVSRRLDLENYDPARARLLDQTGVTPFELTTIYPGLILGTGYNHETGTKDEITLGPYFDHVSGLPVLPGSSVKGAIRATFPRRYRSTFDAAAANAAADFLLDFLTNELKAPGNWTHERIDQLEQNIFASGKDVFYDGIVVTTNREGRIVGPDFLTPHKDNPLRDPNPLRMLKVLPGVGFQFAFRLTDFIHEDCELSADQKLELFRQLLLARGIGAKTNVGYGQLMEKQEYATRTLSEEDLLLEKKAHRELMQEEIQLRRQAERRKRALSSPDEWRLTKQPSEGDTIEVYGEIQPLTDTERNREENKKKPRKRVKIIQTDALSTPVDNKWSPNFYSLEDGSYVRLSITIGKKDYSRNVLFVAQINSWEPVQP